MMSLIQRIYLFFTAILIISLSQPAFSKSFLQKIWGAEEEQYLTYKDIPHVFLDQRVLKSGITLKDYIRYLQGGEVNNNWKITEKDIKEAEQKAIDERIRKQAQMLIMRDFNRDTQIDQQEIIDSDFVQSAIQEYMSSEEKARIENQKIEEVLGRYDHDKNGIISYQEMFILSNEEKKQTLSVLRNNDKGYRQSSEYIWLDPTDNGVLDSDDMETLARKVFNTIDLNDDEILSLNEYEELNEALKYTRKNIYVNSLCRVDNLDIGEADKIYWVKADKGKERFEEKMHIPTRTAYKQIDIIVSEPGPITLFLNIPDRYPPVTWNFNIDESAKVSEVFLAGYGPHEVIGLPENVIVENLIHEECGLDSLSLDNIEIINPLSRQLLKREVNYIVQSETNGTFIINDDLYDEISQKDQHSGELNEDPTKPFRSVVEENDTLDVSKDIKKGILRFATQQDWELWEKMLTEKYNGPGIKPDIPLVAGEGWRKYFPKIIQNEEVYVILKEYECPYRMLQSAEKVSLLIPKGVPNPTGIHCENYNIYNMNTLTCVGPNVEEDVLGICKNKFN
jgi:Ca2+-binding EF-hand superfamily protein